MDYYRDQNVNWQLLLWAVAVRQQLERWEPLVAAHIKAAFNAGSPLTESEIWQGQIEHHFALVAARNLLHAIDLAQNHGITVDADLRQEIIEGRDLLEHWKENLPIFNVTPRPAEPKYRSGKSSAARHPNRSPYYWLHWTNKRGPLLLPNVAALDLRELIDRVEAVVLASSPSLSRFVPTQAPSSWMEWEGGWWPA